MIRIGRRNFLLGTGGAVMAIPALEGLVPRAARAEGNATPFLLTYLQIMGVCQDVGWGFQERFWPTGGPGDISVASLASDAAAGRSVGQLKDFADKISLVRRVHCVRVEGGTSHNSGAAQVLTGSGLYNKLVSGDFDSGNSFHHSKALSEDITQRVAREIGGGRYLGVQTAPTADEVGYAINTNANLGQAQGSSMNAEYGPRNLYERLFPAVSSSPQELLRQSVNDRVRSDLLSLAKSPRLSADDKRRLEQHTESVRLIELRMACALPDPALGNRAHSFGNESDGYSNWDTYEERAKLCNKLSVIAVNCGASQVVQIFAINSLRGKRTDMFEPGSSKYDGGMNNSMHQNSHRNDAEFVDNLSRNDRWHMRRFAEILQDLGPSGFNILDNGVTMFHTDIATGDHQCSDIPFILAGTAGGRLKMGKYIDANTTNNKLLATVGAALGLKDNGAPITQFGGKKDDGGTVPGGYIEALKDSKFPT